MQIRWRPPTAQTRSPPGSEGQREAQRMFFEKRHFGEINELFILKKLFMKLTFDIFGNLFDNDLTFEIFIRI